jgi:seryl-tRNA synthetase
MIDLAALRNDSEKIKRLKDKDPDFDVERLLSLDEEHRLLMQDIELLRAQKNELAKAAQGGITDELRQKSIEVGKQLKEKDQKFEEISAAFKELYLFCPNVPGADIPVGGKEANKVVKTVGKKPTFDFELKNHVELGNDLGWFDFEAAARMAGSQFALYKGDAVKLIYALTRMMLKNNVTNGFKPILPPYMVNAQSLEVSGNFPKFKEDVYAIKDENLYMTPTAEVNLTNLYRDAIVAGEELPIRMTAWTSCFRREAGGYGAQERGLIRIHEFEKVELYSITDPEKSNDELDKMVSCATSILDGLGLHYRISLLATGDMSFPSAKTYDIEVWMPAQNAYYEVSSCSNCTDFQARRGKIRFRKDASAKTSLVNTLNASSLALPRLMVALMETYQQADGSIVLPENLQLYMDW